MLIMGLAEIANLKNVVQGCDVAIAEQEDKKQKALEGIERNNRFLHNAGEMFGMNTSDLDLDIQPPVATGMKRERLISTPSNGSIEGLSLPKAMKTIMRLSRKERLSVTEIHDLLVEAGFKSNAENFRNIVYNTLHRITGKDVEVEKEGNENYYRLIEEDKTDSLLR